MDQHGMDRLITRTYGQLARAWATKIGHLLEVNSANSLAVRLHDPHNLLVDLETAAASFAAAELAAYHAAGQGAARWLASAEPIPVRKKLVHFDAEDPTARAWAERNRLDRVREITGEQRAVIRRALSTAQRTSENPLVTATRIRASIGLTEAQEEIVDGYRALLERGRLADALQRELSSGVSDRVIAAAQRSGNALTPAQIETAVDRYRDNFIVLRAQTIARTEAQRIAHEGSDELYRQAIERGDVAAEDLEATWYHSPSAKDTSNERAFHRSMHGQTRRWGEPFTSGLGNQLRFPGDPDAPAVEVIGCRCARAMRLRPVAARERSQDDDRRSRIGVSSIGDQSWLAEPEPAVTPRAVVPLVEIPAETPADPYRTPGRSLENELLRSDKPAPAGYEAWQHNGQTYYRHALQPGAPYYTPSQLDAIQSGDPLIGDEQILRGPNEQLPGFDTVIRDGEARFMPKTTADDVYHVYTRDQVVSGEAADDERFLAEAAARAAKKPGLLARVRRLFGAD